MSTSIFMYLSLDNGDCAFGGSGNRWTYPVGGDYGTESYSPVGGGGDTYFWFTEPGYPNTEYVPGARWDVSWTIIATGGNQIRYTFELHRITSACTLGALIASQNLTTAATGRHVVTLLPNPAGDLGPFPVDGWDQTARLRLRVLMRRDLLGTPVTHTVTFNYDPEIQRITRVGAVNVLSNFRFHGKRGEFDLRRSFEPFVQEA